MSLILVSDSIQMLMWKFSFSHWGVPGFDQNLLSADSHESFISSQHIWSEFIAGDENGQVWLGFFCNCQDFV